MSDQTLRWSAPLSQGKGTRKDGPASPSLSPTIKNHTATHIGSELYVFGGYDGLRNHNTVHVLDCDTLNWREAEVCVSLLLFLNQMREDRNIGVSPPP